MVVNDIQNIVTPTLRHRAWIGFILGRSVVVFSTEFRLGMIVGNQAATATVDPPKLQTEDGTALTGELLPKKSNRGGKSRFKKGNTFGRRGKPVGTKNKVTVQVKQALVECYEGMGGLENFIEWGKKNETEFYKLFVRLLPMEVMGAGGGPIQFEEVRRILVTPESE